MVRMAVYYRPPDDEGAFEEGYVAEHLPMIQALERMRACSFNRVAKRLGGDFPYSHVFVGAWETMADLMADATSAQMGAAVEDAKQRAPKGFDVAVLDPVATWERP